MQSIVLTCLLLLPSSVAFAQTARSEGLFKEPISSFVFDASLGNEAPSITVWYYLPDTPKRNTPVVFLMHGSSRTGKEARDLGLVYAKQRNESGLMSWFHEKSLVTDELVRARFKDRLRIDDGYTIERHLSDHRNARN